MTLRLTDISPILEAITYKDWRLRSGGMGDGFFLQVAFPARCTETGQPQTQTGRKWYVSSHAEPGEVVRTAFMACLAAEEHEAREAFRYCGKAIFGPHISVAALIAASGETAKRVESEASVLHIGCGYCGLKTNDQPFRCRTPRCTGSTKLTVGAAIQCQKTASSSSSPTASHAAPQTPTPTTQTDTPSVTSAEHGPQELAEWPGHRRAWMWGDE